MAEEIIMHISVIEAARRIGKCKISIKDITYRPGVQQIDLTSLYEKVEVGKDQEKAQSERDSHSKNRGGKNTN